MRNTLLSLALLLAAATQAQNTWQSILSTDPYLSNGYFIVNADQRSQLNIAHIDIDIIMATLMPDGTMQKTTLQQFSITNNFYGKADLSFLDSVQDNQRAYYHLAAFDQGGHKLIDYEGLPVDGASLWPEVCRQTCNAPSYSWTLHLYTDGAQSQIDLLPGYVEVVGKNWTGIGRSLIS
jgi:hypothetical protein